MVNPSFPDVSRLISGGPVPYPLHLYTWKERGKKQPEKGIFFAKGNAPLPGSLCSPTFPQGGRLGKVRGRCFLRGAGNAPLPGSLCSPTFPRGGRLGEVRGRCFLRSAGKATLPGEMRSPTFPRGGRLGEVRGQCFLRAWGKPLFRVRCAHPPSPEGEGFWGAAFPVIRIDEFFFGLPDAPVFPGEEEMMRVPPFVQFPPDGFFSPEKRHAGAGGKGYGAKAAAMRVVYDVCRMGDVDIGHGRLVRRADRRPVFHPDERHVRRKRVDAAVTPADAPCIVPADQSEDFILARGIDVGNCEDSAVCQRDFFSRAQQDHGTLPAVSSRVRPDSIDLIC